MLQFEWNEEKNETNQAKHNISFEDALDVFNDVNRIKYISGEFTGEFVREILSN